MCSKALFYMLGIGWLLLDFLHIVYKKNMTSLVKEQFLSTWTGIFPAFINSHFKIFVVWFLYHIFLYFFTYSIGQLEKAQQSKLALICLIFDYICKLCDVKIWKWQIKTWIIIIYYYYKSYIHLKFYFLIFSIFIFSCFPLTY